MSSLVAAEGNYTSYALYDTFDNPGNIRSNGHLVNCQETKALILLYVSSSRNDVRCYDIATKTLGESLTDYLRTYGYGQFQSTSHLGTYLVGREYYNADYYLAIYKNGALLQRILLSDLDLANLNFDDLYISPRAKYILLNSKRISTGVYATFVLVGS